MERAVVRVVDNLRRRVAQKGRGAYIGKHEALGIITEEYAEVLDAVHEKRLDRVVEEASDLAVACIWTVASLTADEATRG